MRDEWFQVMACHMVDGRKDDNITLHRHRDPQWYCCTGGEFDIEVDGLLYRLLPGQHLLVPPWVYRANRLRRQATYLMCRFRSTCIDHHQWAGQLQELPKGIGEDLQTLLARLASGAGAGDPLTEVLLLRILLAAQDAVDLDEDLFGPELADVQAAESLVTKAEAFMNDHLADEVTRAAIAEYCHCSPAHLARLCRARRGRTPLEILTDLRMAEARRLLVEDTRSIGAIASAVGFATSSHFGVIFKRIHGMTPSVYRRSGGRMWWHQRPEDGGPLL